MKTSPIDKMDKCGKQCLDWNDNNYQDEVNTDQNLYHTSVGYSELNTVERSDEWVKSKDLNDCQTMVPPLSRTHNNNSYMPQVPSKYCTQSSSRSMGSLDTMTYNGQQQNHMLRRIQNVQNHQYYPSSNKWYSTAPLNAYTQCSYPSQGNAPHMISAQFASQHMMDAFQLTNSGREARNRAEKNRRDRLNASIQELSTLIPHVADSPRRVDKIAILRFATHGLRLKHVFGKSLTGADTQTTDTLMKLLDSFFLTLTSNGQIVLISSSVEQHLGHCQADLYGQNILNITHPEDHLMFKQKLIPTDLDELFRMQSEGANDITNPRTQAEEDEIDRRLHCDKRTFTVRLAKAGPRSEPTTYELVRIDGTFRRSDLAPRGITINSLPAHMQILRRSRRSEDALPLHTMNGNDILLVAIARIVKPPIMSRGLDNNLLEYKTRHLIDGRIVDCDQRISLVAGYMQDEVCNLSPFTFMHQDDVRWVIVALRQMYDCNSSYGESTYRLFTRNGGMIYLHTRGYLEIDKATNKVHSFICINTQLDEVEGRQRIQEMKNKFSIIINTQIPQSTIDVPAAENPQQLERAVLCLIQNLQTDVTESNNNQFPASTSRPITSCQPADTHIYRNCCRGQPSLALVPPTADTIKTSIVKSVGVLKVGKTTRYTRGPDINYSTCTYNNGNKNENVKKNENNSTITATVALKRKLSFTSTNSEECNIPIQRRAIENALTSSLQQLDNKLNEQLCTAMQIRDQQQRYEIPHAEENINNLMKEHRKQRDMFNDIATEFQERYDVYESAPPNKDCHLPP